MSSVWIACDSACVVRYWMCRMRAKLSLCTLWRHSWGVEICLHCADGDSFTPLPLYPLGKNLRCLLSRFRFRLLEKRKIFAPVGIRSPDRPFRSVVTAVTELCTTWRLSGSSIPQPGHCSHWTVYIVTPLPRRGPNREHPRIWFVFLRNLTSMYGSGGCSCDVQVLWRSDWNGAGQFVMQLPEQTVIC